MDYSVGISFAILLNKLNQPRYTTNSTLLSEQQAAQNWNFRHNHSTYTS